jgi:ribosomal protein S18 acetylase RimI-like enzyme
MVVTLRAFDPAEWETFRDLRLESLEESPDAYGSTLARERAADETAWRGWLTGEGWNADLVALVAEEDGSPAGIAVCARFHDDPSVAHLFAMWVRPSSRGRGLGRALVAAVIERAAGFGVDELVLRVTEGNDAAAALYRSCGFVEAADPPEPLREGSEVTCRTMLVVLRSGHDDELLHDRS